MLGECVAPSPSRVWKPAIEVQRLLWRSRLQPRPRVELGLLQGLSLRSQPRWAPATTPLSSTKSIPASVASIIDGGEGADTLRRGRGEDTIYGGDDHDPDTLKSGGGDDVLYGVNIFHPRRDSGATT